MTLVVAGCIVAYACVALLVGAAVYQRIDSSDRVDKELGGFFFGGLWPASLVAAVVGSFVIVVVGSVVKYIIPLAMRITAPREKRVDIPKATAKEKKA